MSEIKLINPILVKVTSEAYLYVEKDDFERMKKENGLRDLIDFATEGYFKAEQVETGVLWYEDDVYRYTTSETVMIPEGFQISNVGFEKKNPLQ